MVEILKDYQFLVGALTGSLAAYILGLIVQHLRRPKKWLGYSIMGRRIAEKSNPKLVVHYDGREIEKLHSFSIQVQNIGNQALRNIPVTIQASSPAEIVDTDVSVPAGDHYNISKETLNTIIVNIGLLNKEEQATIDIITINAANTKVSDNVAVVARQEDLECKKMLPPSLPITSDPVIRLMFRILRIFVR